MGFVVGVGVAGAGGDGAGQGLRGVERGDADGVDRTLSPRFVLLHTLGHLLINELVFTCGYSSASLRERLYVSSPSGREMAGLLIYTAAGDSEGTMGGLVRMARPLNLRLGSCVGAERRALVFDRSRLHGCRGQGAGSGFLQPCRLSRLCASPGDKLRGVQPLPRSGPGDRDIRRTKSGILLGVRRSSAAICLTMSITA